MNQLYQIWLVIWPIIQDVYSILTPEQKMSFLGIFILGVIISIITSLFLPERRFGDLVNELVFLLWSIISILIPFVFSLWYLAKEEPYLTQLLELLIDLVGWEMNLGMWVKVIVLSAGIIATERFLIHQIANFLFLMLLKGFAFGEAFEGIIRIAEGCVSAIAGLFFPILIAMMLYQADPIMFYTMAKPPGVADEIWNPIVEGCSRAQSNGVPCNPYLILAIKEYETGSTLCTAEYADLARPNACVSYADCEGNHQFNPETFNRNAKRRGREDASIWDLADSSEIAAYFLFDEVRAHMEMSAVDFVAEMSVKGLIWNADPVGMLRIYNRAKELENEALKAIPEIASQGEFVSMSNPSGKEYMWPAPVGSYVTFEWGVQMFYGKSHNGIDFGLKDANGRFTSFDTVAVTDGTISSTYVNECNRTIITLKPSDGSKSILYVHMDSVYIPNGTQVSQGEVIGRIFNGTTSCSDGAHLHLMYSDGSYIGVEQFFINN